MAVAGATSPEPGLIETPLDEATIESKTPIESEATIDQQKTPMASAGNAVPNGVEPPPDGGLRAWLQVVAGHLIVFNTWGYIISFGVFQPYYETTLGLDPSAVSWIGSIQTCLVFLVGTLSGRAFDAGHYLPMLLAGSLMQLVGIFTTSVSARYWQLFLAQGLCQGLGCGLVFAPTIANMSTYFSGNRTVAIAVAACGGGTGGLVFPLIAQQLLPRAGFAWTVRVMGLVVLVSSIVVLALTKTRLPPRRSGALVDLGAFKETTYLLFAVSMFFTLWAIYFVYFYARAYALDKFPEATQSTSFAMLMVMNAIGVPGRLIPAYLADRHFGAVNALIPLVLSAAACTFAWPAVKSVAGAYAWVALFGFFGAGIQGMFPATLAGLSPDLSKSGTRIGMVFTIISVATLTGPPLGGKLIVVANGSYIAGQIWGGACFLVGAVLLVAAGWASRPRSRKDA